jgi:hypothetical protein
MSERNDRQPPPDHDGDGHDGNDYEGQGHTIHDERELVHYVHDMLRSLEAITAGRALMPLSRSIGAAKDLAHSILMHG